MLVSAITPVYGHARFLPECLNSLRNQGLTIQSIVIDDGNSVPIKPLSHFIDGDLRDIKLLRQSARSGIAQARNLGLEHALGEAIIFLDADDYLMPGSIKFLADTLANADADAVFGRVREIGRPQSTSRTTRAKQMPFCLPGSTLIRRSSLASIGEFDASLEIGEFVDFMARAKRNKWNIVPTNRLILHRRIHEKNTSTSGKRDDYLRVVRNHLKTNLSS